MAMLAVGAGYVQLDAEMVNTTCHEEDTVRIMCDVTGYPLPNYRWYKDGVIIDSYAAGPGIKSGDVRFNIKTTPWGSR